MPLPYAAFVESASGDLKRTAPTGQYLQRSAHEGSEERDYTRPHVQHWLYTLNSPFNPLGVRTRPGGLRVVKRSQNVRECVL